jgi:hypothetical protein
MAIIRKVDIDRKIKTFIKQKDIFVELLIDCDSFYGNESLITNRVKKQISVFLNWKVDQERKKIIAIELAKPYTPEDRSKRKKRKKK